MHLKAEMLFVEMSVASNKKLYLSSFGVSDCNHAADAI